MISERNEPSRMACTAVSDAALKFFSPARLATNAVTPMDKPQATEYKIVSDASVKITVEDASMPILLTK